MSTELNEKVGSLAHAVTEIKEFAQQKWSEIDEKGTATGQTLEKIDKMVQDADVKLKTLEKRMARRSAASEEKASEEVEFKSVNDILRSYGKQELNDIDQYAEVKSLVDKYMRVGEKGMNHSELKSINGVIDPDGGYVVAPERSNVLGKRSFDGRAVAQNVTQTTIGSNEWKEPVDDALYDDGQWEDQSSATGADLGNNAFKEVSIPVGDLYFPKKFSRSVLMDNYVDLETEVLDSVRMGNDRKIADGVLNGLGTTESPIRGLLTYDAGTSWGQIEQITSFANDALSWEDVLDKLPSALPDDYHEGAAYFMRRQSFFKLLIAKDAESRFQIGNQIQFFSDRKVPMYIIGSPVLFDAGMPAIADGTLAVGYGDLAAAYRKVMRVGFSIHRDESNAKFVTLTGRNRCGGGVKQFRAVKLLKIQ